MLQYVHTYSSDEAYQYYCMLAFRENQPHMLAKKKNGTANVMSRAEEAASVLRGEIRGGKYSIGQQLADEYSLADTLGVSRGTLRQALELLADERLVIRQKGRGTFVSNPASEPTQGTAVALLGMMVYEKEYYFGKIIHAASARATNRGYVLTTASNSSPDEEAVYVRAFLKNRVRGVILVPRDHDKLQNFAQLQEAGVKLITLDRMLLDAQNDFVSVDDFQGTYVATQHLIRLGHTRLAYIGSSCVNDIPCRPKRYQGFKTACQVAGLDVPKAWRIEANEQMQPAAMHQAVLSRNHLPGSGDEQDYTSVIRQILLSKDRPTAFVAYSDALAIRVIDVARSVGLKPPQDLSVTGFDDSDMAKSYDLPITSVHPEFAQIGAAAVDLLIENIENRKTRPPRSTLITPRLVIRESTMPPKA